MSVACNATAINNAITAASPGDTISVDAGTMSSGTVTIDKAVYIIGNGTLPWRGSTGNSIVSGGGFNCNVNNFRLANFKFTNGTMTGNAIDQGLIDHITLDTSSTNIEFIKIYGPTDAWTTDHTMGTEENIFVEDSDFSGGNGSAQCVQGNYNARIVFRYNTVDSMKFDMHGIYSNGGEPYCDWDRTMCHSARHCEVYENTWIASGGGAQGAIELRGGTGVIYNNTLTVSLLGITLRDYCASQITGNCSCNDGNPYCPSDYPWHDQIGRGKDQALEPMYLWGNIVNGEAVQTYYWGVPVGEWPYTILYASILSASHESYCGSDVGWRGGGTTSCDMSAVIQENRDYYMTAKLGYSAYTYPHPLQGEGGNQKMQRILVPKIHLWNIRHIKPKI